MTIALDMFDDSGDDHRSNFRRLYSPLVSLWVRRMGIAEIDTPKVVDDVFQRVQKVIDRPDSLKAAGSFRMWLKRFTQNVVERRLSESDGKPPNLESVEPGWTWTKPRGSRRFRATECHYEEGERSEDFLERMIVWLSCIPMEQPSPKVARRELSGLDILTWVQRNCPERDVRIFAARFLDGKTADEIAREFEIFRGVVYQVLSLLRVRMRREFSG